MCTRERADARAHTHTHTHVHVHVRAAHTLTHAQTTHTHACACKHTHIAKHTCKGYMPPSLPLLISAFVCFCTDVFQIFKMLCCATFSLSPFMLSHGRSVLHLCSVWHGIICLHSGPFRGGCFRFNIYIPDWWVFKGLVENQVALFLGWLGRDKHFCKLLFLSLLCAEQKDQEGKVCLRFLHFSYYLLYWLLCFRNVCMGFFFSVFLKIARLFGSVVVCFIHRSIVVGKLWVMLQVVVLWVNVCVCVCVCVCVRVCVRACACLRACFEFF